MVYCVPLLNSHCHSQPLPKTSQLYKCICSSKIKITTVIELPKGFESNDNKGNFLQLNKNLYSSGNTTLAWFEALKQSLESRGFKAR